MDDPPADFDAGPMVSVFRTESLPEGLLVKGLLESAGITVIDKGMAEGPYRMGPVDLWVPEEEEDEARALIRQARDEGRGSTPTAQDERKAGGDP
jgi:hypothetical protein